MEQEIRTIPEFVFPHEVKGWLTEEEGRFLTELAEGKDCLEIGSYQGRSTVCIAQTARHVCAVDPFDGRSTPEPGTTLDAYDKNLSRYKLDKRVDTYIGTSKQALPNLERDGKRFDLAFVDGAHDCASVTEDVEVVRRLLRPGGLVAFHDYRSFPGEYDGRWDPGVTKAVDLLVSEGAEMVGRCGSVAVLRLGNLAPPRPDVRRHFDAARIDFLSRGPSDDAVKQWDMLVGKLDDIPIGLGRSVKTVGKKRCYLGMPHLGQVDIEPIRNALMEAHDPTRLELAFVHHASSLLANGFNKMWCDAINVWDVDYWAMLHADVEPTDPLWLHMLIDEMEAGGFHAMHAPNAIKDDRGLTSTAAGVVGEPFGYVRKLSVYELLNKCPATFDGDQMLEAMGKRDMLSRHRGPWCLLPNTGCLVVKMTDKMKRFPGFTIKDRIVRLLDDGTLQPVEEDPPPGQERAKTFPQVASEDWNFGRWCHDQGLRVGGTRKLKLKHHGRAWYGNHSLWGTWLQDEGFLSIKKLTEELSANGEKGVPRG